MQRTLKFFATLAILFSMTLEISEVEAAELNFQELRGGIAMPVLPERIRYRNTRRGPTKVIFQPKEFPKFREEKENKKPVYVQRHPKRPPPVYVPRRPVAYPGQRGSYPPKNFGPPRASYRR